MTSKIRYQSNQYKSVYKMSALSSCLESMRDTIRKKSNLAKIIDTWPNPLGEQLSQNCYPLRLTNGILFIGAEHPQWRQAILYNKIKLLSSIKANGHKVKDIKIQQYHPQRSYPNLNNEVSTWEKHPSRIDVHGISTCLSCGNPAPAGEMALWGHCGFCRRIKLK